ncbi:MAG: hypothetical protein O7D30_04930 [Rickettsia endosymbiont of Ixodes persulcatus]|nr:hypothetical protein [Rickettsia endosymbiont of Ixodes persulcatus]
MQYLMDLYHTSSTELVLLFVMLVSLIPVIRDVRGIQAGETSV